MSLAGSNPALSARIPGTDTNFHFNYSAVPSMASSPTPYPLLPHALCGVGKGESRAGEWAGDFAVRPLPRSHLPLLFPPRGERRG